MNFPTIKPGDAKCILLTASVSFAVGVVVTFSLMTLARDSSWDSGEKISKVRYKQGGLECSDGIHSGNVEQSGDDQADDARHKTLCDEMRRIAKEIAQTAVEEHHPKPIADAAVEKHHPKAVE